MLGHMLIYIDHSTCYIINYMVEEQALKETRWEKLQVGVAVAQPRMVPVEMERM